MKRALAISGNSRVDFFRRACKYYSEKFPDFDLYLATNFHGHELHKLKLKYPAVKGFVAKNTNLGFHPGAIDVIDMALGQVTHYDQVISIHCDILIYDRDKMEKVFNSPEFENSLVLGSRLVWGNGGLCTEHLYVNMKKARELEFLPLKNTCIDGKGFEGEAETCMLENVLRFGPDKFFNLGTRGSYGFLPEIGIIHMHPPQTPPDTEVLRTLGLAEYAVENFKDPL